MKALTGKKLIIVYISLIAVLAIVIFNFIFLPNRAKVKENNESKDVLKSQIGDMSPLDKKIAELTEINNGLVENIDKITSQNSNITMTREEFLVFLGDCMNTHSVDMVNFSDLGTEEENGVYKSTYDIQMRGTQKSLNEILKMIDSCSIQYSIGSVSLREDKEEDYLQRYFDEYTKLDWYARQTPEPTEAPVETPIPTIAPEETEPMIEDDMYYEESPFYAEPSVLITPAPQPGLPAEEIPSQSEDGENITDRLNKLLEQTSYNGRYELKFLTNNNDSIDFNEFSTYTEYEKMLLNITIQFIMYQNPEESDNSILNYIIKPETDGGIDAVL